MAIVDISLSMFSTEELIKEIESRQRVDPFIFEKIKTNLQRLVVLKRANKQNTEEFEQTLNVVLYDVLGRCT